MPYKYTYLLTHHFSWSTNAETERATYADFLQPSYFTVQQRLGGWQWNLSLAGIVQQSAQQHTKDVRSH